MSDTFTFVLGGDFHQEIDKFEKAVTYATNNKVDAVFITGDLVDDVRSRGTREDRLDGAIIKAEREIIFEKEGAEEKFSRLEEIGRRHQETNNFELISDEERDSLIGEYQKIQEELGKIYSQVDEADIRRLEAKIREENRNAINLYRPGAKRLKDAGIETFGVPGNHEVDIEGFEKGLGDLVHLAYREGTDSLNVGSTNVAVMANSGIHPDNIRHVTPLLKAAYQRVKSPYLVDGQGLPEDHPRTQAELKRVNYGKGVDFLLTHELTDDPRLQGATGTAAKLAAQNVKVNVAGHKHAPAIIRQEGGTIGLCAGSPDYLMHGVYNNETQRLERVDVFYVGDDPSRYQ